MEIVESLTEFGLTRQEAIIYLSLLAEGDQNGYELAKNTGISRSNTYSGLAGLVAKGAAWTIEGGPTCYHAVSGAEFTGNRLRHWQALQAYLLPSLPLPRQNSGSYLTIRGRQHILDRMFNLVAATQERIYAALEAQLLMEIMPLLMELDRRGCKLVILSDCEGCGMVMRACPGAKVHNIATQAGQIRLIVDSHHVLTGELSTSADSSCLYSDHHNLIELFKSALKNEIRLAQLEGNCK